MHLPIESLAKQIAQLQEMVDHARQATTQTVALRGHLFPTPGRPTATIEILVTSGLDWRPARTATVAGRTIDVAEQGTTRPGPVVAGSLLRVELSATPEVARSSRVEIGSGDRVLIIALDEPD
jgi:hypothetical protein